MTKQESGAQLEEQLEHVEFWWSTAFGRCYDCGAPAAYTSSDHGHEQPQALRCSVCAAHDAATNGSTLIYLFSE